jgi:hypothetical protein
LTKYDRVIASMASGSMFTVLIRKKSLGVVVPDQIGERLPGDLAYAGPVQPVVTDEPSIASSAHLTSRRVPATAW